MDAARCEPDLEALLRESAWVRGLARGLLGGGAAADDLAQDVLVAALDRRPGLEGARLRGWLRTVARRLALRSRERGGLRERAERESLRHDDADRESERRLELQRELTAALGELEPADRTVLMLRYFDGLSTGDLAQRLGLAEPAARKRVSRALERLRDVLDRRAHGDRAAWSLALAGLIGPRRGHDAIGATAVGGAGLLLSKATWTLVAAAAVGALLLGLRRWIAPTPSGPELISSAAPQLVAPYGSKERSAPVEPSRDGLGRTVISDTGTKALDVARVRVVDARGEAVPSAAIAWIDAAGEVRPLQLDADAAAELPDRAEGARFFACAEDRGGGFARASDPGSDLVVKLCGTRSVRGRVIEDGGAPRQPILLRYGFVSAYPGIALSESSLLQALRDLGAAPPTRFATTAADGAFWLENVDRASGQLLSLPSTHYLLGGPAGVSIPADARELVLETARLPCVVGRMVWDDTDKPVCGTIALLFRSRESSGEMVTWEWLDDRGGFAFGIPIDPRAVAEPFEARSAAATMSRVRIWPGSVDSKALGFERIVDLTSAEYPLDVGTLRVPRAPILHVRVVGPDGAPIAGAVLASDLDHATSDAEGRAVLASAAGTLLVLAVDHALATVERGDECTGATAPLEVQLAAGATLEVQPPADELGRAWVGCCVQLTWDESPFEGAGGLGSFAEAEPMPSALYRELFGRAWMDLGHRDLPGLPGKVSIKLPARGSLLVPGWRAGGVARLVLLDAAEHPVGSVELQVPLAPQRFQVDLSALVPTTGRLEVRALDPTGRPIERFDYALTEKGREGIHYVPVDGDTFVLEPVAQGSYVVTVRAPGYMEQEFTGVDVTAYDKRHELVLRPARRLRVALVDSSGRMLAARHVEARGSSGTWEARDFPDHLVGTALFPELPLEPFELRAQIGAHTWTHSVDAEQTALALDLPPHGRLGLDVAARERLATENGRLWVRLRALEGEDSLEDCLWVSDGGVGPVEANYDLLPGHYALEVDLQDLPPESLESDPPLLTPLLRREVVVRAGETCGVSIEP